MAITKQDELNQLKVIKASYDMYEETKKTTINNMKKKKNADGSKRFTQEDIDAEIQLIETAQAELLGKYQLFGGDPSELAKKKSHSKKSASAEIDEIEAIQEKRINKQKESLSETSTLIEKVVEVNKNDYAIQASYDLIPLPSKGECYKNKMGKLPVAYLTAYDENMIIAPNLYRDNLIIDTILKEKVLNDTIDVGDLLEGDRDAIILFLRANGYGNEYPITATDGETGEEFNATVDLSQLKFKEFNLKGDDNGWFDFTLPVSKKEVKFRFLTHNDIKWLNAKEDAEEKKIAKANVKRMAKDLDVIFKDNSDMDAAKKGKIRQAINTIEEWGDEMEEDNTLYTHSVTNRLELSIMSIDNVTDRKIIREFVRNMNVRDSAALRKYIKANEPGIDYNIKVEKPESLGGGSMSLFLQLDQYVFLNITE